MVISLSFFISCQKLNPNEYMSTFRINAAKAFIWQCISLQFQIKISLWNINKSCLLIRLCLLDYWGLQKFISQQFIFYNKAEECLLWNCGVFLLVFFCFNWQTCSFPNSLQLSRHWYLWEKNVKRNWSNSKNKQLENVHNIGPLYLPKLYLHTLDLNRTFMFWPIFI